MIPEQNENNRLAGFVERFSDQVSDIRKSCENKMFFGDAIAAAARGYRVRRKCWFAGISVGFDEDGRFSWDYGPKYDISVDDALAEDWEFLIA